MLAMRDHDVTDYQQLRDMDGTDVRELHDDDRACLDDIGRYLVAADAWQRFGVWLLHKHFDPAPGEVFVERVMTESRRTETSPVKRSAHTGRGLQPTAVRFDQTEDDGVSGVSVIGMEFAAPADFGSTMPLGPVDEAVLAGIADRLAGHGKTDRFGVRLLRDAVDVAEHEILMETCDRKGRTLHCDVSDRSKATRTVETTWGWRPAPDGMAAIQKCYFECEVWTDGEHTRTGC